MIHLESLHYSANSHPHAMCCCFLLVATVLYVASFIGAFLIFVYTALPTTFLC